MEYSKDDNCTCPGCIKWDDFDQVYINFEIGYHQELLTKILALEYFDDFPDNLPLHLIIPQIARRHEDLTASMKENGEDPGQGFPANEDAFYKEVASIPMSSRQKYFGIAYLGIYHMARFYKKMPEMEYPQFDRFLLSQSIVVICAYAEGFIANTLRKLCEFRPGPYDLWKTKRKKKISNFSKSEVLEWFVFEMGFGGFDKKINRIEDEFEFKFPISKEDRDKIKELFLIRNCIVHNAGLVSKAYKQAGITGVDMHVGDEVSLSEDRI